MSFVFLALLGLAQGAAAQPDAGVAPPDPAASPDAGLALPPPDSPPAGPPDGLPPPPPPPSDRVALVDAAVYALEPRVGEIVTQMVRRELETRGFEVVPREEVVAAVQAMQMPYPPALADLRRLGATMRVNRVVFPRAWARSGRYVFDITTVHGSGTSGYAIGSPTVGEEPAALGQLIEDALAARTPPPDATPAQPVAPASPVAPGLVPGPGPWAEQPPPPAEEDLFTEADRQWGYELEAHVQGGMMWHPAGQVFDEFDFTETAENVAIGMVGAGGRVEAGSRNHGLPRFVGALEADVWIAHIPATGSEFEGTFQEERTVPLGRAVPTLAYDSRTFEVAGGVYLGSGLSEDRVAMPAGHVRFGRWDGFNFRMSVYDERGCYATSCLAALSFGFGIGETARVRLGFSFAEEVVRAWSEVDFEVFGEWFDVIGDFAVHNDAATLSLSLGMSWPRERPGTTATPTATAGATPTE